MRRRLRLRAASDSRFSPHFGKLALAGLAAAAALAVVGPGLGSTGVDEPGAAAPLSGRAAGDVEARAAGPDGVSTTTSTVSPTVPPDMRSVTITTPDPIGLRAGDTVDVTAVFDPDVVPGDKAVRILRRATVRSVEVAETAPDTLTVSLLVPPDAVGRVEFATRHAQLAVNITPVEDDGAAPVGEMPEPVGTGSGGGHPSPAHDQDHDD